MRQLPRQPVPTNLERVQNVPEPVAVNPAAKDRGLSAGELVKGALSGRGGGNADLAQGGGVPDDQVPALLTTIEKLVGH